MKIATTTKMTVTIGIISAMAFLASIATTSKAGDFGTAKGGATKLTQFSAPIAAPVTAPLVVKPMTCAKCTDTYRTVIDTETKGGGVKSLLAGGAPTKVVRTHQCPTCTTDWVVKGVGKSLTSVPIHKCDSCN